MEEKATKPDCRNTVPEDQWEHDVWLMGRRLALLYYFMSKKIIEKVGEEEGKVLIKEAIWDYGTYCGKAVAEGVLALGLPLTEENFRKVPDLPSRGWRSKTVTLPDGQKQNQLTLCPLAVTWMQLGFEDVGRIYCFVDQSKTEGYNPALECIHAHNVLDGDAFCEIVMRQRKD